MCDLGLEVGGQVDDVDGAEGALLRTDTAADAETFGYVCDLGLGGDFDAELSSPDDRAGLFALLPAFLEAVGQHRVSRRVHGRFIIPSVCTRDSSYQVNRLSIGRHRAATRLCLLHRKQTTMTYLVAIDNSNSEENVSSDTSACAMRQWTRIIPGQFVRHDGVVLSPTGRLDAIDSAGKRPRSECRDAQRHPNLAQFPQLCVDIDDRVAGRIGKTDVFFNNILSCVRQRTTLGCCALCRHASPTFRRDHGHCYPSCPSKSFPLVTSGYVSSSRTTPQL